MIVDILEDALKKEVDYFHSYSLGEALKITKNSPLKTNPDLREVNSCPSSMDVGNKRWFGTENFEEAYQLASHGDPENYQKIEAVARNLFASGALKIDEADLDFVNDVAGGVVDVGRFLSGEPECMIDCRLDMPTKKLVSVFVCISGLSDVSADAMARRGAAIFSCIRALELKGYSVELSVGTQTKLAGKKQIIATTIKQAGEYVDPEVCAFWIANPSSFRRLFFRLKELQPRQELIHMGISGGYGQTWDAFHKEYEPDNRKKVEGKVVVFNTVCSSENSWSDEKWLERIQGEFEAQGITVF